MRINGFEQIKAFYSWSFSHQNLGVKPQHVSLYLFLVNQNNRNNWIEWFKVPYDLAMAGSCISSKKTYYSCLDDLVKWKLIKYEKGVNNWKAPLIKLEVLKDTSTVPQSEPQLEQADVPQHIQALIQAAIPQPIHNIKLLTYNLKPITDNLKQIFDLLNIDFIEEGKTQVKIDFEIFWVAYDKKVGPKKKLEKKWNSFTLEIQNKILENIPLYKIAQPDKGFRKNPESYFNAEGWNDEIIKTPTNGTRFKNGTQLSRATSTPQNGNSLSKL